jgi:hypothetical protein
VSNRNVRSTAVKSSNHTAEAPDKVPPDEADRAYLWEQFVNLVRSAEEFCNRHDPADPFVRDVLDYLPTLRIYSDLLDPKGSVSNRSGGNSRCPSRRTNISPEPWRNYSI